MEVVVVEMVVVVEVEGVVVEVLEVEVVVVLVEELEEDNILNELI